MDWVGGFGRRPFLCDTFQPCNSTVPDMLDIPKRFEMIFKDAVDNLRFVSGHSSHDRCGKSRAPRRHSTSER